MRMVTYESVEKTRNTKQIVTEFNQVNVSGFMDRWGPENVVQVYDSQLGIQGVLVIDNTARGK